MKEEDPENVKKDLMVRNPFVHGQTRYYYYITNGVDTSHVADLERSWIDHVLRLVPDELTSVHPNALSALIKEMREEYNMSVRKAIGTR
jgi:hypothetical protein